MSDPFRFDSHVHTSLSPCGDRAATPLVMWRAAQEMGLSAIGFTDHYSPGPVPTGSFYARPGQEVVDALRAALRDLPCEPDTLIGIEADYTVLGEQAAPRQVWGEVDYIIIAASHYHLPGTPQPPGRDPRTVAAHMLAMARRAVLLPGVSILAHPFACNTLLPLPPLMNALTDEELVELAVLARDRRVALELNGGPSFKAETYKEGVTRLFVLAKEVGARFTICSDAHRPADLARAELAAQWAREIGLREADMLLPDELRAWHRAKTKEVKR